MYTHEKKIQTKYIGCGSNNFVTVSSGPPSGDSKILWKLHPDFNDVKIWGWEMYILELIKHSSYFKHCSVSKFTFKYHCSDYLDQTYRLSKFLWKTPGLSEDQACAWDPHVLRSRGWHYTTKSQWQATSAEWDVHRPFRRLSLSNAQKQVLSHIVWGLTFALILRRRSDYVKGSCSGQWWWNLTFVFI